MAPVVDPCGLDVRVAEPLLDLGDVGAVFEGIGIAGRSYDLGPNSGRPVNFSDRP